MKARKIDGPQVTARLIAIKRMVANLKDAMPRAAAEMRREACEEIDDLIDELRTAL